MRRENINLTHSPSPIGEGSGHCLRGWPRGARAYGLMGPMGPIGLIGPMGLIRLMGLIGLMGLGLMGCSSDSLEELEEEAQAVGFSASIVANATRAAGEGELTTELLKEEGFGVYCWYTGMTSVSFTDAKGTTPLSHISTYTRYELMRNQKVVWDPLFAGSNKWTYSPTKYWPTAPSEKLTFRAYAPYTDYLVTDNKGMPQLPVVVASDDYHNNTQHDPLWGTSRHAGSDDEGTTYGSLYNNYTWEDSGDHMTDPVEGDPRNGCIDWYFHHGMAKIIFWGLLSNESVDDEVTIDNIQLTPLYNRGLLNISSPVGRDTEHPIWTEPGGDMTVDIDGEDLAANTVQKYDEEKPNNGWTQLTADNRGLLFIPRNYSDEPITLTVTITPESGIPIDITTTINQEFFGNTVYTFKMTLGSTVSVEIQSVNAAVTPWTLLSGDQEVYNW